MIKNLCVYCGSSMGVDPAHRAAATALGTLCADAGIGIVYGGGRIGLMGATADAAMAAGGRVTGVIPRFLHDHEVGHHGITELLLVDTMHERKQAMAERSDGFVILPGGFGTLEEAFEVLTWRQLRLHDKPIVFVNVNGYWDPYRALVTSLIAEGFARPSNAGLFETIDHVEELLPLLRRQPPAAEPMLEATLG